MIAKPLLKRLLIIGDRRYADGKSSPGRYAKFLCPKNYRLS
ncbi:MAG: hypothetical protein ABIM74_03385 [candidate division WOR-3 bacterium]